MLTSRVNGSTCSSDATIQQQLRTGSVPAPRWLTQQREWESERERETERGRKAGMTSCHQFQGASYPSKAVCMCVCVRRVFTWAPAEYLKQLWRHQRQALRWVTGYLGPSLRRKCAGVHDAPHCWQQGDRSRGPGCIPLAWLDIRGWTGSSLFSVCLFYCCVCFDHGCSHHSTLFGNLFYFIYPCHYH